MNKYIKASYEGKIVLNGKELNVARLHDSTRVITKESIYKAFNKTKKGRVKRENEERKILPFVDIENLREFIDSDLEKVLVTINYYTAQNKIKEGYNADIVLKLSNVYLTAEKHNKLSTKQLPLAKASKILISDLLEKNIKDIIDIGIDYKYELENKEILSIFKKHMLHDFYAWHKIFPVTFFKELFRLNGWNFTEDEIKIRPSVIATWINKLIFEELAEDAYKKTKNSKPKIDCIVPFDYFITNDINNSNLKTQINKIITLLLVSDNMKEMWLLFYKLKLREGEQLKAPYSFNDMGYTIEPIEESTLSDFNLKLKLALSYNSKNNQL